MLPTKTNKKCTSRNKQPLNEIDIMGVDFSKGLRI